MPETRGRKKDENSLTYSPYRHVSKHAAGVNNRSRKDKYHVKIGGKAYGTFDDEIEAAKWADKIILKKKGEEADLNFPPEGYAPKKLGIAPMAPRPKGFRSILPKNLQGGKW